MATTKTATKRSIKRTKMSTTGTKMSTTGTKKSTTGTKKSTTGTKRRAKSYITRTYYVKNKKTGRRNKVTKKYYKRQMSPVLTFASGKIQEERVQEFLATLDPDDRQDAMDLLKRAHYNKIRMSAKTLRAKLAGKKRISMVLNTGDSLENTLKTLHASEEEFLDDRNWKKGGIFTNSKGETWKFNFRYKGAIWKKQ